MNPLNAREQIQLSEDHPLPNPPIGIPGLISSDAIVAAYVALMQQQCDLKNTWIQGVYGKLVADWKDNNSRGIYNPAPGPMTLVHLNADVAAEYEKTGVGSAGMFAFYDMWDPDAAPGSMYTPPPAQKPPEKAEQTVGERIPGTSNLYNPVGSYSSADVGSEITKDGAKYVLINSTPMGFRPMWLKTS